MTLIEMMIVVAIVGIIAAIAVPNMNPVIRRQHLTAAAEEVAGMLDRARKKAYVEGRCYRVRVVAGNLVMQRKGGGNGADCVGDGSHALTGSTWETPQHAVRPPRGVTFTLTATGGVTDLIFRPNGRVRGNGDWTVDDTAQVVVNHPGLGAGIAVRVLPHGRICKIRGDTADLPAVGTAVTCPREGA